MSSTEPTYFVRFQLTGKMRSVQTEELTTAQFVAAALSKQFHTECALLRQNSSLHAIGAVSAA